MKKFDGISEDEFTMPKDVAFGLARTIMQQQQVQEELDEAKKVTEQDVISKIDKELQKGNGTNWSDLPESEWKELLVLCIEHGVKEGVHRWILG